MPAPYAPARMVVLNDDPSSGLATRRTAVDLLGKVLREGLSFDTLFQTACDGGSMAGFTTRDRAFVRLIATTALRRKGQIEDALSRFLERPLPLRSGHAREILLIGAAQLLFLDTPPHAAIDLAVRCAGSDRASSRFKSLINAVLRRIAENGHDILASQNAPRLNTPSWLWRRWTENFGEERATDIALAHLTQPPLDLSVVADPAEWNARLRGHLMPTGTVRLAGAGRISEIDGYDEGGWWVQDAAAALPVKLLGDVRGQPVLDLCAAPGGKSAQLAAAGAIVTAVDASEKRIRRLQDNLKRLGLSAHCVAAPIARFEADGAPRRIMLDAPCTSTGTIRRHPDIAHCKDEKAVSDLARVQRHMLDRALELLAPGGILVFCTCSLEPEEGEQHGRRCLERGDVVRLPIAPGEIGEMSECLTPDGDLRTVPCHYQHDDPGLSGLDGFFAMRLQKL